LPFIGVDDSPGLGKGVDLFFQSGSVGMMDDPQADLPTLTAHRTNDRRAVILIGAVAALFVGSAAGWILWIGVILTFFPPRSETFHPFQSVHPVSGSGVGAGEPDFEFRGVAQARFGD
jgi:hypothetical protein